MSAAAQQFAAAFAEGDPATLAAELLAQLPDTAGATLGILYVSDSGDLKGKGVKLADLYTNQFNPYRPGGDRR